MRCTVEEAGDNLLLVYFGLISEPLGSESVKSVEIDTEECSLLVIDIRPDGRLHGVEIIFAMDAASLREKAILVEQLLAKAGVEQGDRERAVESLMLKLA